MKWKHHFKIYQYEFELTSQTNSKQKHRHWYTNRRNPFGQFYPYFVNMIWIFSQPFYTQRIFTYVHLGQRHFEIIISALLSHHSDKLKVINHKTIVLTSLVWLMLLTSEIRIINDKLYAFFDFRLNCTDLISTI